MNRRGFIKGALGLMGAGFAGLAAGKLPVVSEPLNLADGQWHHILMSVDMDRGMREIYIDDVYRDLSMPEVRKIFSFGRLGELMRSVGDSRQFTFSAWTNTPKPEPLLYMPMHDPDMLMPGYLGTGGDFTVRGP